MAELSARFDATLEPIADGGGAEQIVEDSRREPADDESDAVGDESGIELFAPHSELGTAAVDAEDGAPSGDADVEITEAEVTDVEITDADADNADVAAIADVSLVDGVPGGAEFVDVATAPAEPDHASPDLGGAPGVDEAAEPPHTLDDDRPHADSLVQPDTDGDGESDDMIDPADDMVLTSDAIVAAEGAADISAAVGEPAMGEATIATFEAEPGPDRSGDNTGLGSGDDTGGNTEIVLSEAAERLNVPPGDGMRALDRLDLLSGRADNAEPDSTEVAPATSATTHDTTSDTFSAPAVDASESRDNTPGYLHRPDHADSYDDGWEPTEDVEPEEFVDHGPRWYRKRIQQFGVVAGLVPMVILGALASLALAAHGALSGQIGLVLGTAAAPGLLVAGAPFANSNTYPYAAVGSIPFWLLLGWVARRRTLRRPVADWKDYATQLTWLTLAVVLGAAAALVIAAIRIGGPLLG